MWSWREEPIKQKCCLCRKSLTLRGGKLIPGTSLWLKCIHVRGTLGGPCDHCGKCYEERDINKHTAPSWWRSACVMPARVDVWSKKKSRPGRRAVPQGGPLGLDRSSTAFVRSSRKIYPLVSQILEDLGRRNPWRAWLGDHQTWGSPRDVNTWWPQKPVRVRKVHMMYT